MKKISITTEYWLLKEHEMTANDTIYYYVRVQSLNVSSWMVGYLSSIGIIYFVGPEIVGDTRDKLEIEFQKELKEIEISEKQKRKIKDECFLTIEDFNEWWYQNDVDIISISSHRNIDSGNRNTVVYYHENN